MFQLRNSVSILFLTVIVSLSSSPAMSNGGPVEWSNIGSSGNVQLKQADGVELVYEKLFIKPVNDYVDVRVVYEINCNEESREVDYGFPFKNVHNYDSFTSFRKPENNSIKFFSMKLNGAPVTLKQKISDVKKPDGDGSDEIKWFLAKLNLQKGKNTIEIDYSAKSCYEDTGTSKDKYTYYGTRTFSYNFKPAAGWGKGVAGKLEIVVDTSLMAIKRVKTSVTGIKGMQKQGNIHTALLENADIAKLKDLEISYEIGKYYLKFEKQINGNKTSSVVKSITASSSLKGNYSPKMLIDGKYKTSWSEGVEKHGIDEWIEVEFKDGSSVTGVAIANGFMRTKDLFRKNSRVKTLLCEIQGNKKGALPESFSMNKTVELKDLKPESFPESDEEPDWSERLFEVIDREIVNIIVSPEDFEGEYEITKIRLIIKDVYPGAKFEDTCITELFAY